MLAQDDHLMSLMEVCADAWQMAKNIDFTDPDFRERYWWIFPEERPKKKGDVHASQAYGRKEKNASHKGSKGS